MKISVGITTYNEERSITPLLGSLLAQTKKADEIVVVDGDSKDKTVEIIRHYQKKDKTIKLLVEKCSRARGRNLAVEMAKNETIAMTDSGCVADKYWLERITEPFKVESVDIVAGFYEMTGETPFQKAEAVFLGVMPEKFDIDFLPSTRSIAFRKTAWERIGGFPERKGNSAEDTDFNYKAIKLGIKYSRVKRAVVEWGMPESISNFQFKIYNYAKWDAKSGIWWNPVQKFSSHNIKALSIFARYLVGILLLLFSINSPSLLIYLSIGLIIYIFWAYRKAGLWGIVLQFVSDFAVMAGFLRGII